MSDSYNVLAIEDNPHQVICVPADVAIERGEQMHCASARFRNSAAGVGETVRFPSIKIELYSPILQAPRRVRRQSFVSTAKRQA